MNRKDSLDPPQKLCLQLTVVSLRACSVAGSPLLRERASAAVRMLGAHRSPAAFQCAVSPRVSEGPRELGGMTARHSLSLYRLEAEIQRCRAECQWDRIPSLVETLAAARFHEDGK